MEFQPSSREIPGKRFGIGSLRKVWISWSWQVWKSNPEYSGAEQGDKMKDASLCNYLIKVLSSDCGLSCTSEAKRGIRTSVCWDFVQQEESLPCRSTIQGLGFYMRAEGRSANYLATFSQPVGAKPNPLTREAELHNRDRTCGKVLKLNPWDFCSLALEKHLCWKAPHLIAGETWSEQKGDSQPLAKLLALLSGFYQPCGSQKVPFRCIFPERLNASVQITVLGINCPLRQNNWSLRPCAQHANHV